MSEGDRRPSELCDLFLVFLRLGVTAFGGPAAHIAMMEHEVVRRRQWMTSERFLDLLGATNLIPGPNSTELAIHIGLERAGFRGLLVAGASFIGPAALITGGFGWAYVRYGALPEGGAIFYGVKAVVIAIVVQALWGLSRKAVKTVPLGVLASGSLAGAVAGVNELVLLVLTGVAAVAFRRRGDGATSVMGLIGPIGAGGAAPGAVALASAAPFGLPALFVVFAKIGAVLFGSGYVLLAFLRRDLVERLHWLTEAQLLDAVAVGQITPGPVFTTATFIGYVLARTPGAVVATAGIFLPAFVFVALSGPLVSRMRSSPTVGAFLDGVNVASLALMAVVTVQLGRSAIVDWTTAVLGLSSAVLLFRFKASSTILIVGGAAVGLAARGLF